MAKLTSLQEVTDFIKARYPLVFINTHEELQVKEALKSLAHTLPSSDPGRQGRTLVFWSCTKGVEVDYKGPTGQIESMVSTAPAEALAYIQKVSAKADAIVVLLDMHPYMKEPTTVRALRDTAEAFRAGKTKRTLIVLAPVQAVPVEVEKIAAVLDWDLPTREQVGAIAKSFVNGGEVSIDVINAALGLDHVQVENACAKSLVRTRGLDPLIIQEEKKQIIRKSGLLDYIDAAASIDAVGGLGNLKRWLGVRRNAFTAKAREFKLPAPKGVIVVGVPGTGKTLLAMAIGAAWGMPILQLDMGKIFGGLVGASEENIRRVLKTVEAVAPCILVIDEIEKALAGSSGSTDSGTSSRVFGTFLTWMNDKKSDVFVVATANNLDSLPPELLRKGRFDELFFVDLPTKGERVEIFKIQLRKYGRAADQILDDVQLDFLAEQTDNYTGAEIEQIVKAGLYDAFAGNSEVNYDFLRDAINQVVPISRAMAPQIEKIRDWVKGGKAQPASDPEPDLVGVGRRGGIG